ncbi:UNVERIFIED_CONTAM: hypothetical protein K2H54_065421 [Gekko kuhli]
MDFMAPAADAASGGSVHPASASVIDIRATQCHDRDGERGDHGGGSKKVEKRRQKKVAFRTMIGWREQQRLCDDMPPGPVADPVGVAGESQNSAPDRNIQEPC